MFLYTEGQVNSQPHRLYRLFHPEHNLPSYPHRFHPIEPVLNLKQIISIVTNTKRVHKELRYQYNTKISIETSIIVLLIPDIIWWWWQQNPRWVNLVLIKSYRHLVFFFKIKNQTNWTKKQTLQNPTPLIPIQQYNMVVVAGIIWISRPFAKDFQALVLWMSGSEVTCPHQSSLVHTLSVQST